MAKINTLTVEGSKRDGYTVTAMTDEGAVLDIKEGFEFVTAEEHAKLRDETNNQLVDANQHVLEARQLLEGANTECNEKNAKLVTLQQQFDDLRAETDIVNKNLADKDAALAEAREQLEEQKTAFETLNMLNTAELHKQLEGKDAELERMRADIGQVNQMLAAKPAETRTPLLHREHQAIPVGRKIDQLAPLDALAAAPAIDPEPVVRPELAPDAPARPPGPSELVKIHSVDPAPLPDPVGATYDNTDDGKTGA